MVAVPDAADRAAVQSALDAAQAAVDTAAARCRMLVHELGALLRSLETAREALMQANRHVSKPSAG